MPKQHTRLPFALATGWRASACKLLFGTALLLPAVTAWSGVARVRVQTPYELGTLDPHKLDGSFESTVAEDLFEGLTAHSATGAIIPGAAQSWETSADGLIWTFHLRHDATWSDGKPVTAEDFVYSFRRAVDPATACPYLDALLPIRNAREINTGIERDLSKLGVIALDPLTVQIALTQRTPWLIYLLTEPTGMPVPRQAVQRWGDQWTQPEHMVTNGPFILRRRAILSELDLERNPRFHGGADVRIDEVDYVLADDTESAMKRYLTGDLDVLRVLGKQDLQKLKHDHPVEVRSYPELAATYLVVNMRGPHGGADPRVRRALAMTIDREVLEHQVVRRGQLPAYSFIPSSIPDYEVDRPEWARLPMAQRISTAKALLAAAGVSKPLHVRVMVPRIDFLQLYARAISQMWHSELGIEVEQEDLETRVAHARLLQWDFDIALDQWNVDFPDPWAVLELFRTDAATANAPAYRNRQFDSLLDQARTSTSTEQRTELFHSAESLLLDDQPVIPVNFVVSQMLVNPRVHGIESSPTAVHPSRFLSITEQR